MCGETEGLHLHHLTYERLGAERLDDLTPLCPNCHAMVHVLVKRGEMGLDFAGFVDEQRQQRYAKERNQPQPGESWGEVHADRLMRKEAKVRSERVRHLDLELWRANDPRRAWFVSTIEAQIEGMRQEARAA